ncbi:MAG TPA: cupredoxin domain-containing protein [Candidatus Nanoarchaeia archaeon]|nr:cupredoxin domain-containing protein [Candidatus Nanoarchaeia archaeon]
MKSHISWAVVIVLIIAIGGIFMLTGQRDKDTGTAVNGTAQKVTIGMKNGNYYPNTLTVNAGQPVELALDSSVTGCFRSFTIRELGISKYVKTPADTITFTLPRAGTYAFACSMGMGYGTLIVE